MGFRFRKSIKILPGVKLNIGKKGINSVSVGGHGFTKNISKNGTRTTVGIPGSGISYTDYKKKDTKKQPKKKDGLDFSQKVAGKIVNAELNFQEVPFEMEKIPFFSKAMKVELAATILFCLLGIVQIAMIVFAMPFLLALLFSMIFNKRAKANTAQFYGIKNYKLSKWQECVDYCNKSLKLVYNESTEKLRNLAQEKIDTGFKNKQFSDKEIKDILDKA
ncbi:DUF4236 domain-containing protein [Clostridium autoethanogenum]|uniref:DUF4236 domain-containing protein n=1 Tax=Clostridium autoethanogenum DSM 10061 TaxID=1341692 RepID=A0ABM5NZB5_9CLOT|nr:DUF4236 domain-containing protein [Clostridium autoethanogenum]AGY77972.1 DUF4236 domain-containing protein [Clostridium autoethanogenum DSM 10061]ALU38106.1 Hypothetical protein CLAU_3679 [Clostridium autoethanogenum DSM 10061]OVY50870.1 hypothetical protein WX72_02031 [Clostridium autoethanogenum]DAD54380.1 TPA_exp: hypothetical protein CAETHG_RS20625 [Clostridium autoethanogenum DSM 10061]